MDTQLIHAATQKIKDDTEQLIQGLIKQMRGYEHTIAKQQEIIARAEVDFKEETDYAIGLLKKVNENHRRIDYLERENERLSIALEKEEKLTSTLDPSRFKWTKMQ